MVRVAGLWTSPAKGSGRMDARDRVQAVEEHGLEGCAHARAGTKRQVLFASATGTQTTFGTAANPTLLGSPIIEPLNANVALSVSSCISCHGGASFNATGVPNFKIGGVGPQSPPTGYVAYDFMWGLLAAQ